MPIIEPVVLANVLSEFRSFVTESKADPAILLAIVGWDYADIEDPKQYVSLNTVAELFELAARHTRDPSFGLHYAGAYPPGGTGLLGSLMLSSATVGEVMKVVESYLEVLGSAMQVRLDQHDGVYSLHLEYPPNFTAPQIQYTGFLLASLALRLRLGAGPAWRPFAVEFAHRKPDDLRDYHFMFGHRLTFDGPRYRFDVEAEDFEKPMPKLWQGLAETIREHGDIMLAKARKRQHISVRLAAALSNQLDNELPFDLEAIAAHMTMPVRALQWRLEQAGTSYERLLGLTRRRLAVRLLRDTDLTMAQIAVRLGYSEASSFTRAAQGWFNEAPSARRRRLREGEPDLDDPDFDSD